MITMLGVTQTLLHKFNTEVLAQYCIYSFLNIYIQPSSPGIYHTADQTEILMWFGSWPHFHPSQNLSTNQRIICCKILQNTDLWHCAITRSFMFPQLAPDTEQSKLSCIMSMYYTTCHIFQFYFSCRGKYLELLNKIVVGRRERLAGCLEHFTWLAAMI